MPLKHDDNVRQSNDDLFDMPLHEEFGFGELVSINHPFNNLI